MAEVHVCGGIRTPAENFDFAGGHKGDWRAFAPPPPPQLVC